MLLIVHDASSALLFFDGVFIPWLPMFWDLLSPLLISRCLHHWSFWTLTDIGNFKSFREWTKPARHNGGHATTDRPGRSGTGESRWYQSTIESMMSTIP